MTYSLEHLGAEYTETGMLGSEGEVSRIIPGIDSNNVQTVKTAIAKDINRLNFMVRIL